MDSGYIRPQLDALHLVVHAGRAAFIDTGTSRSLSNALDALESRSVRPEAVDWVILTHVHLDHAGGAGAFMARFGNARLAVHPRGARHMADPSRLWEGTVAVYGAEEAGRLYGDIQPVEHGRIIEAPEGAVLDLAGRQLLVLDTPGHARHHLSLVDSVTGHIFAGDTFGLSYRELDQDGMQFVMPTSSPVQFDPEAEHHTLDRLMSHRPGAIYVTHYGQLRDTARLASDMHRQVDVLAAIGRRHRDSGTERVERMRGEIIDMVMAEGGRYGWRHPRERIMDVLGFDIDLNAQGLVAWQDSLA